MGGKGVKTINAPEAFVEKANWADNRRLQDILQPLQAWICDGNAKEEDEMLDRAIGGGDLSRRVVEDEIIGLRIVDLVACALRASVDAQERHTCAELTVDAPASLLDIRSRAPTDDVAGIFAVGRHDIGVPQLDGVCGRAVSVTGIGGRLLRIGRERRLRGRNVMLEEHVVLVRHASYTAEDGTTHEMVGVRAEPIDDVVIVPDVELRDLAVSARERLSAVPPDVVVEVVLVASRPHVLVERVLPSLPRIGNVRPRPQRTVDAYAIVVDLVAASNHDVERLLCVHTQHVVPEGWARPCLLIGADGKAVAGVKHDAHALMLGRHDEALGLAEVLVPPVGRDHAWNGVLPRGLLLLERQLESVLPEGLPRVLEQPDALKRAVEGGAVSIGHATPVSSRAHTPQTELLGKLTWCGDDQDTPVPYRIVRMRPAHAPVVQQRTADDVQPAGRRAHLRSIPDAARLLWNGLSRLVRVDRRPLRVCGISAVGVVGQRRHRRPGSCLVRPVAGVSVSTRRSPGFEVSRHVAAGRKCAAMRGISYAVYVKARRLARWTCPAHKRLLQRAEGARGKRWEAEEGRDGGAECNEFGV